MPASVDEKWHRRHDYFNLLCIPAIIATNFYFLGLVLYDYFGTDTIPAARLDGAYAVMFWVFATYMAADVLWVLAVPRCVASPLMIILHHIVSLLGWITPVFDPAIRPWTAAAVTVELNTFFLIVRRNLPSNRALDAWFLVSWALLRLGVYPYIAVGYYQQFALHIHPSAGLNVYSGSYICLLLLMSLNLKWTVDLV
ncbi:unnamed protein product, partial [Ectocarpus fasciculatus]